MTAKHLRSTLEHWTRVLGPDVLLTRRVSSVDAEVADARVAQAEVAEARVAAAEGTDGRTSKTIASAVTPTAAPATRAARLAALASAAAACRACRLGEARTQAVFADGDPQAEIFFCGEGPGADEDRLGLPFVGKAGELLTRIIEGAMGVPREAVYIANIVKCRPPGNRNPEPDEQAACMHFLHAQLEIVSPRIVIALGKVAAHALIGADPSTPMSKMRGRVHHVNGRAILPTWHPAYLLRTPAAKAQTWDDIKVALRFLGRPERPEPYRRPGA